MTLISLLHSQISGIAWLQQFHGLLPLMRAASFLGNEEFFLLLLPFFYFCEDTRIGLRLGLLVLLGDTFNILCKYTFAMPRPYWLDSGVRPLSRELTFGLPSSHAQNAASVWGYLASLKSSPWGLTAPVVLVALISVSRVYLGVHYGTDVLAGVVIGGALLFMFLRYGPAGEAWFERRSMRSRILFVTAAASLLLCLGLALRAGSSAFALSSPWAHYAAEAYSLDPLISRLGALWGLGLGWALALRKGLISAKGPIPQRIARWILGMIGVLFFWKGLSILIPLHAGLPSLALRFVRYALMTLWVTYLAPQLFLRLGLAKLEAGESGSVSGVHPAI